MTPQSHALFATAKLLVMSYLPLMVSTVSSTILLSAAVADVAADWIWEWLTNSGALTAAPTSTPVMNAHAIFTKTCTLWQMLQSHGMRACDTDFYSPPLCRGLSMLRQICPSVTLRYCVKTREPRRMQSSLSLVFWWQKWLMGTTLSMWNLSAKGSTLLWKQPSCTHFAS